MYGTVDGLFATLQGRHLPEQVAAGIATLPGFVTDSELAHVLKAVTPRGLGCTCSACQSGLYRSSMSTEWDAPKAIKGPAVTLAHLLKLPPLVGPLGFDTVALARVLDVGKVTLHMNPADKSYKNDRLNRAGRRGYGMTLSRRRYDKLFRLVTRLDSELADFNAQTRVYGLSILAKTNYARHISHVDFAQDVYSAAFVAYMTATLARRSLFTSGPQVRAFDDVAEALLARCGDNASWYAIAHVFPRADVLARVPERQRMALLALVLDSLHEAAAVLKASYDAVPFNRRTMVVGRGNDSSTWNAAAGGWNKARDYWLALMESFGMADTFEHFLPGKVLRLMAGDVTSWHQSKGEEYHVDTYVWRELPLPWEVLSGEQSCTRARIEAACKLRDLDPVESGWTAARKRTAVESWRPTPETVHGVVVDQPELARWLRRIGAFSGQGINWDRMIEEGGGGGFEVERDKDGYALGVTGRPMPAEVPVSPRRVPISN